LCLDVRQLAIRDSLITPFQAMAPYSGRARGGAAGQSKSSGAPQKSPQASSSNIVQDQSSTSKTPYFSQLQSLRELFSESWNDDDLIAVLQEVNGDLEIAIARISEGVCLCFRLPRQIREIILTRY
jgi:hypothetical protein